MRLDNVHFDPFTLRLGVDPYAVFARFRAAGAYAWGAEPFPEAGPAAYLFSHRLISEVLKHPDMLQAPPGEYLQVREKLGANSLYAMMFRTVLLADPPRHGELRRSMSRNFSPPSVAALETKLRARARALAMECRTVGTFDLVWDFAVPLVFRGLEEFLGVLLGDAKWLKGLTTKLAVGLDFRREMETGAANDACCELFEFVETLVARKSARHGLLATFVELRDQEIWCHEDLIAQIVFLLFAGQETMVDAIGNAIMALHQNPEQSERLRSGSVSLGQAADEVLRFDPSVQFTSARIAARDLQFGDLLIPAGTGAVAVLGSGNRDGMVYEDPDRLDLSRSPQAPPLAFATGLHACIGRHIARLEMQIALDTLYRFLPPWELSETACARRDTVMFRGLTAAPARTIQTSKKLFRPHRVAQPEC